MEESSGSIQRPEPSSRAACQDPKTPVKRTRFADIRQETTSRSVPTTPASCTSACSNLSSLADTPLSERIAKFADRCVILLDQYFAEQPPTPLGPVNHAEASDECDDIAVGSTSTLVADHESMEQFHLYPELPTELQDMILVECLTVHHFRGLAMRSDGSEPLAPAVAAVDKKTREQVMRILERFDEDCVDLFGKMGVGRSEKAHHESLAD